MTTKIGMADALHEVIASGGTPHAESRDLLNAAIQELLDAAVEQEGARSDVPADAILISLAGIALAAGESAQRAQAGRLMDLLWTPATPGKADTCRCRRKRAGVTKLRRAPHR
ncbi:hypothetical protein I6N91_16340 [Arthrobacter sp. MSA 4-2]|nr:hypothetical protein [Arthrobacter sp. MSA 4-2]